MRPFYVSVKYHECGGQWSDHIYAVNIENVIKKLRAINQRLCSFSLHFILVSKYGSIVAAVASKN